MTECPLYPKGDLRRMLAVLGAIDTLERPTLVTVSARTSLHKKTVASLIDQAVAQAAVEVVKEGPVYRIAGWGPVLKKRGARLALSGHLGCLD